MEIPTTPDGRTTQAGAARYLGISRPVLIRLEKEGKGPPRVQIGGRVFYKVADLDSYIESCRTSPAA